MIGYTSSSGNEKKNNNTKSKSKSNYNKIRNTLTATEKSLMYLVR